MQSLRRVCASGSRLSVSQLQILFWFTPMSFASSRWLYFARVRYLRITSPKAYAAFGSTGALGNLMMVIHRTS